MIEIRNYFHLSAGQVGPKFYLSATASTRPIILLTVQLISRIEKHTHQQLITQNAEHPARSSHTNISRPHRPSQCRTFIAPHMTYCFTQLLRPAACSQVRDIPRHGRRCQRPVEQVAGNTVCVVEHHSSVP